LTADNMDDSYR